MPTIPVLWTLSAPGKPNSTVAFTRTDLLVAVAVATVLATLVVVPLKRVRDQANQKICVNNLRQIGQAVAGYAHGNGDRLPGPSPGQPGDFWWWYKEEVKGYLGLEVPALSVDRVFACPRDRGYSDPKPFCINPRFDSNSYVFNAVTLEGAPNIAGLALSDIRQPKRVLLVMEWTAHAPLSWHRSKTGQANAPFYCDAESVVGFVDGHAAPTKIYYDGYNAAFTRDPIPGYEYQYSAR